MTDEKIHQEYESVTMSNAGLLQVGMEKHILPKSADINTQTALMLGQLQTLCAMIVLGDSGEKAFARKRIKKFIADGKREDLRKAKSVPENRGKA